MQPVGVAKMSQIYINPEPEENIILSVTETTLEQI